MRIVFTAADEGYLLQPQLLHKLHQVFYTIMRLIFSEICSSQHLDLELPPGDTLFLRSETMKIAEIRERY
jgi:hypothetical protein